MCTVCNLYAISTHTHTHKEREWITWGTNPAEACDIGLRYVHPPHPPSYHPGNCNPTCTCDQCNIAYWRYKLEYKEKEKKSIQKYKYQSTNECLLWTCSIHTHYKLKYFFTAGFHNTNSLHSPATALWLQDKNKVYVTMLIVLKILHSTTSGGLIKKITHTRKSTSRSSSKIRSPAPKLTSYK